MLRTLFPATTMITLGTFVTITALLIAPTTQAKERKKPEPTETFETTITEDGTKLFDYRLESERPERKKRSNRSGGRRDGNRGGRKNRPEDFKKKMEARMNDKLEKKLEETGFCREGYVELDRTQIRGKFAVRGECKEGATEEEVTAQ